MNENTAGADRPDRDALDIAFVLLLLQGGFGLVSALGLFVYGRIIASLPTLAGVELLALVVPALALVLAGGVAACRRWARTGALVFESLVLAGAVLRLLITHGTAASIVPLLTTVLIPAVVIALLLSRSARRSIALRTRQSVEPESSFI